MLKIILEAAIAVVVAIVAIWVGYRASQSLLPQVREINRKYAKPELEMTVLVKACLLSLRIYLLVLVALMVLKFIMVARG
jgi:hypothetical protein